MAGSTVYLTDSSGVVYADFAAAVAANPTPTTGQSVALAGGGGITYNGSAWYGRFGTVATWASLPAVGVASGSWAMVSSAGFSTGNVPFRADFDGTVWNVALWTVIRRYAPLTQYAPGNTTPVVVDSDTFPSGIHHDGFIFEYTGIIRMTARTGTDTLTLSRAAGSVASVTSALSAPRFISGTFFTLRVGSQCTGGGTPYLSSTGVSANLSSPNVASAYAISSTWTPGDSAAVTIAQNFEVRRVA